MRFARAHRVLVDADHMIWSETYARSVRVIEEAPVLNDEQKRNVLRNNAARFLRMSGAEIARHH